MFIIKFDKKSSQYEDKHIPYIVSIPSPFVPLNVPSLSLYLLASLSTKKEEYVAWAFSLENFCKSTLSICFPSFVNAWIASLPNNKLVSRWWFQGCIQDRSTTLRYLAATILNASQELSPGNRISIHKTFGTSTFCFSMNEKVPFLSYLQTTWKLNIKVWSLTWYLMQNICTPILNLAWYVQVILHILTIVIKILTGTYLTSIHHLHFQIHSYNPSNFCRS